MKLLFTRIPLLLLILFWGCGGEKEKEEKGFSFEETITEIEHSKKDQTLEESKASVAVPASIQEHLKNKGIGPITSLILDHNVNEEMAAQGKKTFKKLCAACHRPDKKFIGPAPKNILARRSPEWVMNIMLNPIEMIEKDPLTKALKEEFNGAIMPKQNINETDARALLEYFRTL